MKNMNMKKRYWIMNLQVFAGDGEGDDPGDESGDDDDDPGDDGDDSDDDDQEEKTFAWLNTEIAKEPSKIGRDEDGVYHYSCILNCKIYC